MELVMVLVLELVFENYSKHLRRGNSGLGTSINKSKPDGNLKCPRRKNWHKHLEIQWQR